MSFSRALLTVTLWLAAGPLAHAGTYVKVTGLYTRPGDLSVDTATAFAASLKNAAGISGALGYKLPVFRVEAEVQHVRNTTGPEDVSGTLFGGERRTFGAVRRTAGFANAYWDLPSFLGLGPYVGAGLGYARINVNDLGRARNNVPLAEFSGSDSVFGYQAMLGLQFRLFGQATLNAGYRIVKHEDVAVRDVLAGVRQTLKLGTHRAFELGIALGF
jgi:opacity protein-like surface antigen